MTQSRLEVRVGLSPWSAPFPSATLLDSALLAPSAL